MPGGNRLGPRGEGPQTGQDLVYFADNDQPGYTTSQTEQRFGRGFRRGGRGCGRGRNNRFDAGFRPGRARGIYLVSSGDQDIETLKLQTQELQSMLQGLQTRLAELEPEDKERK